MVDTRILGRQSFFGPSSSQSLHDFSKHMENQSAEEDFTCTVCVKAVRLCDRVKHQKLHDILKHTRLRNVFTQQSQRSGEMKFACVGSLQFGKRWGCGTRFAEAEDLAKHISSEVGWACIRPLLEEGTADRIIGLAFWAEKFPALLDIDPSQYLISGRWTAHSTRMTIKLPEIDLRSFSPTTTKADLFALCEKLLSNADALDGADRPQYSVHLNPSDQSITIVRAK